MLIVIHTKKQGSISNMKFPFSFKSNEVASSPSLLSSSSSWPWPSCSTTPRTISFRADDQFATATPYESLCPDQESVIISGLRSERLFFEPGATSSILAEAKTIEDGETDESESVAVVVMDSMNPFVDFRASMAEMVEACGCGVRDWEFLEELLGWYLSVNDETNHGYIVGAFADLLIHEHEQTSSSSLSSSSSSSSLAAANYSFTSPLSFTSYSTEEDINIIVHK
ncbi:transcription repressor OFP15-like [Salvia hispanica]|uniref:transcription repressor OFP15-like n=1 Tax=Salvia hispanica TaxID=49212 RepID=UPI0020092F93|nr:transcription repressor OFP15-like [Salvia hispanica]